MVEIGVIAEGLEVSLEERIARANKAFNANSVIALMDLLIRQRTDKGQFLKGSTPGARTYRSSSWKKKREQRGLPIDRVTLFFTGQTLGAMRGEASATATDIQIEFGYLAGKSDASAMTIAQYHFDGVGPRKVKRHFVGLTAPEGRKVVQAVGKQYATLIR